VIDENGGQLGIMAPFEAMRRAREVGLDLVEISPTAVPPVCKIMDFGKFRYEENKRDHEQRKHHKSGHIKEVKFRPTTAEHDYQVRKNRIVQFLEDGYKVKAMVFHRGREMAHPEVGRQKMARLLAEKEIQALGQVEATPRMEANILLAVLAPKKGAVPTSRPAAPARAAESGGS
jgi:translation initiation factor IF-3